MDKLKQYQEAILDYLNGYASDYANNPSGVKTYVIADKYLDTIKYIQNLKSAK